MKLPVIHTVSVFIFVGLLSYPAQATEYVAPVTLCGNSTNSVVTAGLNLNSPASKSSIEQQIAKTKDLLEQGDLRQALAEINSLQKLAETDVGAKHRGEILNLAGGVFIAAGRFAEADLQLKAATAVAKRSNNIVLLAKVLNNRAILQLQQKKPREAITLGKEGLAAADCAGDKSSAANLYLTYANALLDVGDNDSAEEMMANAHEKLLALPTSGSTPKELAAVGDWYLELAAAVPPEKAGTLTAKAKSAYAQSMKAAVEQDNARISSYASGNLGRIEELARQYDDALRHTRAAIFYAQKSSEARPLLYLWQWQSARILKAQGLVDEAITLNRLAVQTLQANKPLFTGSQKFNFETEIKPVYLDLADMLLRKASASTKEEAQNIHREVLRTVELLRSDELKDYLRDACIPVRRSQDMSRVLAETRTALVHYLVLGESMEVLVQTAAGISHSTVPAPVSQVSEDAWFLRRLMEDRDNNYLDVSRKLYDVLIRPIEAAIAGSSTIVIVPDGVVRTIPIAALHDGKKFLMEKEPIRIAQVDVLPRVAESHGGQKVLLGGVSKKISGYSQIPFVEQELDGIKHLYGGTILENESFTVTSLTSRVKEAPYQMLHIASHGMFADDIYESYILAWDGKLSLDQLGNIVRLNNYRDNPLDLLVLSACSTAAGDERAPLGLAGVAVKAGAGSVIASLWDVDDQATAQFFTSFYRIMKEHPSLPKAEVLQQAQLQMLQQPGKGSTLVNSYAHPYYWAPFVLVTGSM